MTEGESSEIGASGSLHVTRGEESWRFLRAPLGWAGQAPRRGGGCCRPSPRHGAPVPARHRSGSRTPRQPRRLSTAVRGKSGPAVCCLLPRACGTRPRPPHHCVLHLSRAATTTPAMHRGGALSQGHLNYKSQRAPRRPAANPPPPLRQPGHQRCAPLRRLDPPRLPPLPRSAAAYPVPRAGRSHKASRPRQEKPPSR